MPASPESAAEYIAWAKAGTLSPTEAGTLAPPGKATPVEQLRDHLVSQPRPESREGGARVCRRPAGRGWVAGNRDLTQAIDGLEKSLAERG
jgi:hypothetical protein